MILHGVSPSGFYIPPSFLVIIAQILMNQRMRGTYRVKLVHDGFLFKIIGSLQIYSPLGLTFSINRVWSESHHICSTYKMRLKSVSGALFLTIGPLNQ